MSSSTTPDLIDLAILGVLLRPKGGSTNQAQLAFAVNPPLQTHDVQQRLSRLNEWVMADELCDDEWTIRPGKISATVELIATAKRVASENKEPPKPPPVVEQPKRTPTLTLYPWQKNALNEWEKSGRRGIVEAVTGTGKTRVALGAIETLHSEKPPTSILVVVPSKAIMYQWKERIAEFYPDQRVGLIGDGHNDNFSCIPLACVAIINSLVLNSAQKLADLLKHCRNGSTRSFLIADECHHYIEAPVFSKVRQFPFDYTLGLSATTMMETYGAEGLGRIIFEYTFEEAFQDGLIPPFDLVDVGVSLTHSERTEWLVVDRQVSNQFKEVFEVYEDELGNVQDEQLFARLKKLMGKMGDGKAPLIERLFLLLFKRAAVSYTAENKMDLAVELITLLVNEGRKKVMVFFERIDSADQIEEDIDLETMNKLHKKLSGEGDVWCRTYHSGLSDRQRQETLDAFRSAGPSSLLACRALDEGIDLPDVDAAILVASTQSKRQRIQRIGRTLRKGNGTKQPIIVTLFVRGTGDENVTADDATLFGKAAEIHQVDEEACLEQVKVIMGRH